MLDTLTQQLQKLSAKTFKLLSTTAPKIKASETEIKILHERYTTGLDLLKQIAFRFQGKSVLNKCYQTHSELLTKNNTD